ncbi:MAG: hypothetical protein IJ165_02040 [Proteobacteria bacterium]|nr:hypothetical protein [Pseudomonadota bacterium]
MFNFSGKRQLAFFVGGVLFGTAGIKLISSKDARKGYAHVTAAVLRMKSEVMKNVTSVREACSDIMADARDINETRAKAEDCIVEDTSSASLDASEQSL